MSHSYKCVPSRRCHDSLLPTQVTTLYYIAPACAAFLCIPFYFLELPKMLDPASDWKLDAPLLLGSAVSALGESEPVVSVIQGGFWEQI